MRAATAFTLLELITAIAALIVVLGLVVSLARYVRSNASLTAVREQLRTLSSALDEQAAGGGAAKLPMFAAGLTLADEQRLPEAVRALARQNADAWSRLLGVPANACFDPWGMPMVLINGAHPGLGMAPRFRPFFMSAGPDNRYFTLADDVYGYEVGPAGSAAPLPIIARPAATRPGVETPRKPSSKPSTDGGHREY